MLFRSLLKNSKRMSIPWSCHKCDKEWPQRVKRCGACKAWKGGTRQPSTGVKKRKTTSQAKAKTKSTKKGKGPLGEVTVSSGLSPDVDVHSLGTMSNVESVGDDFSWGDDSTNRRSEEHIRHLVEEDKNCEGDGGMSDEEGEGYDTVTAFVCGMTDAGRERYLNDNIEIEDDAEGEEFSSAPGNTIEAAAPLFGAPEGWSPPQPPESWTAPEPKTDFGEPDFAAVDNPGRWSQYTFTPTFDSRKQYVEHSMPAGAVPVPVHPDTGKREVGGYEFFYDGWKHPSPNKSNTRMGATKENLFPKDRSVQLDADVLKRLGLTKQRIENCDALFFYQLLLPIVDPAHSGIKDDPRIGFYEEVATHTNVYAMGNKNRGGTRGHVFRPTNAEELLVWDGIVTRNLADNVAESWMASQSNTYDREIDEANYRRWLDIKACMKLCNFYREKDRKATDYDPTEKYRLVWNTMTHNMRQVITKMGLDHTIDETTWPSASYSDMHNRVQGKKCTKGGQHVLLLDAQRRYIYEWTPRHNLWPVEKPFTASGPAEVKRMVDMVLPLVKGEAQDPADKRLQILDEPPHIAFDNHFSGNLTLSLLGELGFKSTMTCRRDRLPKSVPKKHFHHVKGTAVNLKSKVARFEQPVIAVKTVTQPANLRRTKKDYTLVHVSFQSTGGTNISTVNTLAEVMLYAEQRMRGQGIDKRIWAIEMNEARQMYLKNYSAVDKIDQMLKSWKVLYRTWKWWHAPMRHGKAIAMCMAYALYKHCAEGEVDPEWKVTPVTGPKFRQQMSLQMVQYKSSNMNYPGDEKMRTTTSKNKKLRLGGDEPSLVLCNDNTDRVSYAQYLDVKQPRGKKSRLCTGDLDLLKEHINSMKRVGKAACQWCGEITFMRCELCKKHVCLKSDTSATTLSCCIDFHDDYKYGLGYMDRKELFQMRNKNFKKPNQTEMKKNKTHMKSLMLKYYTDVEE